MSFCSPTHSIVPHISWHDLPYHKTMKKYEDFKEMEVFLFTPLKFAMRTWFCNCLFHIVFEYTPGIHDEGKMLVLQKSTCLFSTFHIGLKVSFQPIRCHPHTQIRTVLFHGVRVSIPNWKPSPSHASIGFSQIAFPTIVLPKDDRANSFQEERLDLPHWTMVLAILCRGRRIQMCGHSDLGILNNFGASSIFTWV